MISSVSGYKDVIKAVNNAGDRGPLEMAEGPKNVTGTGQSAVTLNPGGQT